MPVVFILLAALLFGLYELYAVTAGAWGMLAGAVAVLVVSALATGCVVLLVRRHWALHGRRVNGQRLLRVSGDWGHMTVNAEGRRAQLRLGGQDVDFIFGDIASVAPSDDARHPGVVLRLRAPRPQEWRIPMRNAQQARRWARILTLAEQRTL